MPSRSTDPDAAPYQSVRRSSRHANHRRSRASYSDDEVEYSEASSPPGVIAPEVRGRGPSPFRNGNRNHHIEHESEWSARPRGMSNPQHASYATVPEDVRAYVSALRLRDLRSYPLTASLEPPTKRTESFRITRPYSPESDQARISTSVNRSPSLRRSWASMAPTSSPRASTGSVSISHSDGTFQYDDVQGTEFRLIRLLPETMYMVKCEIMLASLEDHSKYVALSYAWGDADHTTQIQLNGLPFPITHSLHSALLALRKKHDAVLLWADALCINQRNKDEQSQQVRLMTRIYSQAESVIVWLGHEADDSKRAISLLINASEAANDTKAMDDIITNKENQARFAALVALFERDYWRRLWVVQEVLNAKYVTVLCGRTSVPWSVYVAASDAFKRHTKQLKKSLSRTQAVGPHSLVSQQGLSYASVLSSHGPASLESLRQWRGGGPDSLLEVLHLCRRKLTGEPRDKVFGVLGILPKEVGYEFPPNYSASLREVYTNVVDFLLHTTRRFDVVCEAIYFPLHTTTVKLPSWVPDWSHIPETGALGLSYSFSAAAKTEAKFRFVDPPQRTKLEISAIYLDKVNSRGIAVGTLCGLDDLLMAFLHWRAKLRERQLCHASEAYMPWAHEAFCRTICLDQAKDWKRPGEWAPVCYHVFSSLIRESLPHIQMDEGLGRYADLDVGVAKDDRRRILQDICASRMMSRCFFITVKGFIGMGTGFMNPGDVVCVPLGCCTPVLLRPESDDEYRYVGDVYVDGYMHGRAVEYDEAGNVRSKKYVLR